MGTFNSKTFNSEVFLKYASTIKDPAVLRLIQAGVYVARPELVNALQEQVGGNYITLPLKGRLNANADNYDGVEDMTEDTLGTFKQGMVVIGRMHGFKENDFTEDITHHDFMADVAQQLMGWWAKVNQGLVVSILKGIFGSALANKIVSKTFGSLGVGDIIDALELNGDQADAIKVIAMHSHIAFKLQKANLLDALKYTDKNGVERDTGLYAWQGRIVVIDDGVGVSTTYASTTDDDVVAGKVYYTRSGSAGSYVYTKVASPVKTDIATYYEKTNTYPCYLMGNDAFVFQDVGVRVPVEMERDGKTDGGIDVLRSRERVVIAPYGVSFKANAMSSNSPTKAELETASSWELVKDTSNNAIELKTIPLSCINVAESGI